jgi:hypothetical protein
MRKLLLILSILMITISCEQENDLNQADYLEYINGNSITSDVDFFPVELFEKYNTTDTPKLKLYFLTKNAFTCINYGIAISKFLEDDKLVLRFDSITKSDLCFTAVGPATAYVDLPENINSLVLINGNSIDGYTLDITKEFVIINPVRKSFSYLKNTKTFRYPENTFVYECDMNKSEINIYNNFLKILNDSLSVTVFNFDGEGYKPYGENSSHNDRQSLTKYFHYESELEFKKAGELLRDFVIGKNINKSTSAYISLRSWNNQEYLSWMMHK